VNVAAGRYESDWNIVKRGYEAHILGEAPNTFTDPVEALEKLKVTNYSPARTPSSHRRNGIATHRLRNQ
jgi:2,3-bisphosphoglycerate-independent phosphoglycerate mutase